jgi:hypothetical protein
MKIYYVLFVVGFSLCGSQLQKRAGRKAQKESKVDGDDWLVIARGEGKTFLQALDLGEKLSQEDEEAWREELRVKRLKNSARWVLNTAIAVAKIMPEVMGSVAENLQK